MNLIKYLLSIVLVMSHLLHDRYDRVDVGWLRVGLAVCVPLYQSWWDVYMDCTFFGEKSADTLTRFPVWIYTSYAVWLYLCGLCFVKWCIIHNFAWLRGEIDGDFMMLMFECFYICSYLESSVHGHLTQPKCNLIVIQIFDVSARLAINLVRALRPANKSYLVALLLGILECLRRGVWELFRYVFQLIFEDNK